MLSAVLLVATVGCGKKDEKAAPESEPVAAEQGDQGAPATAGADTDKARIAEDWRKACNAYELSGAAETDPSQRPGKIALWIRDNVKSPEVMKVISSMGGVDPAKRKELILAEIGPYGLTECPLTEVVGPTAAGPPEEPK